MRKLLYQLDRFRAVAVFSDEDPRPTLPFERGTLAQLADWIAEQVLKPPEKRQPPISFPVRVLANAVAYLTAALKEVKTDELINIFGGKWVFENILQYGEGKYPEDAMRRAAGYLLVNQIMFYYVLQKAHEPEKLYDPVDLKAIRKPGDLWKYFRKVLDVNYTPIFGFDVASRLPSRRDVVEKIREVVRMVLSLAPEKVSHDVLGQVFHKLIPIEIRKPLAAFYTNPEAAEMLAHLAIDDPSARVMDLAVGSGTLLVAAYHRKRMILESQGMRFGVEDHKRFLKRDLTGIDVMPFAAHLAVVHLSLQEPLYETERVRIAVWDSTELNPRQSIPAISRELKESYKQPTLDAILKQGAVPMPAKDAFMEKGAVTLDKVGGEEIALEKLDVVIMNPPFTRQERIPQKYKRRLDERFIEYQRYLHGQLGLYGYFVPLADKFLKLNGRMALVLPATILRLDSCGGMRSLLASNYVIEHIITTWQRAAFSERAEFREILLVARKIQKIQDKPHDKLNEKCAVVFLKKIPSDVNQATRIATELKALIGKVKVGDIHATPDFTFRVYSQEAIRNLSDNLFRLIAFEDMRLPDLWLRLTRNRNLTPFSQYLESANGEIIRGVEICAGKTISVPTTFVLRDESRIERQYDAWICLKSDGSITARNRHTGKEVTIPRTAIKAALRRLSKVDTIDISDKFDYVVVENFHKIDQFLPQKVGRRELNQWKECVEARSANLIINWRFDISATGTNTLAFWSATPVTPTKMMWSIRNLPEEDSKILCLWFNSTMNILQILAERVETRGAFLEIFEYILETFLVPDPRRLPPEYRKRLLKLYDNVSRAKLPSILEQLINRDSVRLKIDKAWMEIFGFDTHEIEEIIAFLYPALANEINILKALMAGVPVEEE